jgi:hypothetical protein
MLPGAQIESKRPTALKLAHCRSAGRIFLDAGLLNPEAKTHPESFGAGCNQGLLRQDDAHVRYRLGRVVPAFPKEQNQSPRGRPARKSALHPPEPTALYNMSRGLSADRITVPGARGH